MCACVMTICLTCKLCFEMIARTSAMSSPGSMTIASRAVSSPITEQLHWRGPTGRISWIIDSGLRPQAQGSRCGEQARLQHFEESAMKPLSLRSDAYFCLFAGFGVLCDDPTPDSTD